LYKGCAAIIYGRFIGSKKIEPAKDTPPSAEANIIAAIVDLG
jgi:hypothetical protein